MKINIKSQIFESIYIIKTQSKMEKFANWEPNNKVQELKSMEKTYKENIELLEERYPDWYQVIYRAEGAIPTDSTYYTDEYWVAEYYARNLWREYQQPVNIYALLFPKKLLQDRNDHDKYQLPQIQVESWKLWWDILWWRVLIRKLSWLQNLRWGWHERETITEYNPEPENTHDTYLAQREHTKKYLKLKADIEKETTNNLLDNLTR